MNLPKGQCELYAILELTSPDEQSEMTPQIPPEGHLDVHLVTGNDGVLAGAPLSEVTVFWTNTSPATRVPATNNG